MDFRTLRTFVEVVGQGRLSQAAKVVFTTQSTVSKAVKQLDIELGVPLLDRKGHRSTPTADKDVVYRRAPKILAERDDLVTELDELRSLKQGTLGLGLPPVGSSDLFAPSFCDCSRYPRIITTPQEPQSSRLFGYLQVRKIYKGEEIERLKAIAASNYQWYSGC
jgi:DNA-binding transcriptional LysR family regulator